MALSIYFEHMTQSKLQKLRRAGLQQFHDPSVKFVRLKVIGIFCELQNAIGAVAIDIHVITTQLTAILPVVLLSLLKLILGVFVEFGELFGNFEEVRGVVVVNQAANVIHGRKIERDSLAILQWHISNLKRANRKKQTRTENMKTKEAGKAWSENANEKMRR